MLTVQLLLVVNKIKGFCTWRIQRGSWKKRKKCILYQPSELGPLAPPVNAVSCFQPISDTFQTKCRIVVVQDDRMPLDMCLLVPHQWAIHSWMMARENGLTPGRATRLFIGGAWLVTAQVWLRLICCATNFLLLETTLCHWTRQGCSSNFSRFLFRLRFSKTFYILQRNFKTASRRRSLVAGV